MTLETAPTGVTGNWKGPSYLCDVSKDEDRLVSTAVTVRTNLLLCPYTSEILRMIVLSPVGM